VNLVNSILKAIRAGVGFGSGTETRLRDTVWGVFRAQNAITRSAHLNRTTATKDGAQIERHLVRTHSQNE